MNSFFSNNGPTSVLTNIIAFLNIDPSQIKIVGINPGSTILTINLMPPSINDPVNTTSNASDPTTSYLVNNPRNIAQDSNDLNDLNNKLTTAVNSGTLSFDYPVLNISSTIQIVSTGSAPVTLCPTTYLYNTTSQTCYCDAGYIEINNVCTACATRGNATSSNDPANTNQCLCQLTYVWSDTLKQCVCPGAKYIVDGTTKCFSCAGLVNGTGTVSTGSLCKCNPSFTFFV
jgi:hypothetical protein